MNNHIASIIDIQFKEFRKFDDNLIEDLGDEEVFLKHQSNGIVDIIRKDSMNQGNIFRLNLILPYVMKSIIKYVPVGSGVILCLGDILKKSYNKRCPTLCFSKYKNINAFLIPNIDFFTRTVFSDLQATANDLPFQNKQNKSVFIGASTGSFENNIRVKYGILCSTHPDHKGYISNLCQNTESAWTEKYPEVKSIVHSPISVKEQLQNKIVINIDGNTICWSRLYWQMNSNSIPVYINPYENQIQFFDYIDKTNCYIKSSLDDCFSVYESILDNNNLDKMLNIISNGKKYCKDLFDDYVNNPNEFLQEIIDKILQLFYTDKQ
jgi:hypothetical protein